MLKVSSYSSLDRFQVRGWRKYRIRKRVPKFNSVKDKGVKILVNSCIRKMDRKAVRVSGMKE